MSLLVCEKKSRVLLEVGIMRLYYPTIIKRNPIRDTKDTKILTEVLEKKQDNYVSQYAAQNPNCPSEALAEVLRRGKDDYVSWEAAKNPNCPPEVLAEILKTGRDDFVSGHAASNPKCPTEALTDVLKRCNNNWVSQHAAKNPNCPPKAILDWLEATGRLTKYDPKIHELEKTPIDKDLEELKKLL